MGRAITLSMKQPVQAFKTMICHHGSQTGRDCRSYVALDMFSRSLMICCHSSRPVANSVKTKVTQIIQTRGNVLVAKGILLQTIAITGATTPAIQSDATSNANNFCQVASDLATFAERLAAEYPTGEDKFRVIAKIFEADQKRLPAGPTLVGIP